MQTGLDISRLLSNLHKSLYRSGLKNSMGAKYRYWSGPMLPQPDVAVQQAWHYDLGATQISEKKVGHIFYPISKEILSFCALLATWPQVT